MTFVSFRFRVTLVKDAKEKVKKLFSDSRRCVKACNAFHHLVTVKYCKKLMLNMYLNVQKSLKFHFPQGENRLIKE